MRKKIKLGIFFILTIVLLVFSVSILGNLKLKGNGYRIYVDYTFIGDLLVNGKVSYRGGGINIGFIEDISIKSDGRIRVTLFITDRNVVLPKSTEISAFWRVQTQSPVASVIKINNFLKYQERYFTYKNTPL